MNTESAYWIAMAHLPRWGFFKINNLIVHFYHNNKISIEDFFNLPQSEWKSKYGLDAKQIQDLLQAKSELSNHAFLAETMLNEGFELIPIISPDYSKTLKENLKATLSPPVIYIKGNKKILFEKSIAIVGSRNASDVSLKFADTIAQNASKEYKVVVSGFAKGIDKQALDSALHYKGQSIIVLPQGIMTFGNGYKTYYKQIVDGDVLLLSTFFPKAPWMAELAMARNPIIYGLANEIFVGESSEKGGTWSGVMDGLRKNRAIFVRMPEETEKNANLILIQKGAIPVNEKGEKIENYQTIQTSLNLVSEQEAIYENKIVELLKTGIFSAKEIIEKLSLEIKEKKLTEFLKAYNDVEIIKLKPVKYTSKNNIPKQAALFE